MDNTTQPPIPSSQSTEQIPAQIQEPVKSSSKVVWYVLGGVILLVLLGAQYLVIRSSRTAPTYTQPKPTLPRSKALGLITQVVTATSLDAQGNAKTPSATFAKTEKNIFLVMILHNVKPGTKVEYVRYLNGKYLDSSSLKLTKLTTTYANFVWTLTKPSATHLVGTYRVKVYSNGIFDKETTFTIK